MMDIPREAGVSVGFTGLSFLKSKICSTGTLSKLAKYSNAFWKGSY